MATRDGFFGRTGDEEYDRILAQVGDQMQKFEAAREELTNLRGQGKAADGQVTVEVLSSGSLSALEINPRAMRLGSEALAEAILEAARQATEDAVSHLNEIMGPITGQSIDFGEMLQGKLLSMNPEATADISNPRLKEAMQSFHEMRRKYGI
jgi:DNA-binding protein YbaB